MVTMENGGKTYTILLELLFWMLRSDNNFNKTNMYLKYTDHSSANLILLEKEEYAYIIDIFKEEAGTTNGAHVKSKRAFLPIMMDMVHLGSYLKVIMLYNVHILFPIFGNLIITGPNSQPSIGQAESQFLHILLCLKEV